MSTDVAFFETTQFSQSSTFTSQGEDDGLLVYTVSLLVPTLAPIPISAAPAPGPIVVKGALRHRCMRMHMRCTA